MASSSSCFVVVFVAILSQFLLLSASTKPINAICQNVTDKAFYIKTLTAYPLAASGTTTFEVVGATINIAKSYADKRSNFADKAAKENPDLYKLFHDITIFLNNAAGALKTLPEISYNDANVCADFASNVTSKLIDIVIGAISTL